VLELPPRSLKAPDVRAKANHHESMTVLRIVLVYTTRALESGVSFGAQSMFRISNFANFLLHLTLSIYRGDGTSCEKTSAFIVVGSKEDHHAYNMSHHASSLSHILPDTTFLMERTTSGGIGVILLVVPLLLLLLPSTLDYCSDSLI
jgi:hypothetical protein